MAVVRNLRPHQTTPTMRPWTGLTMLLRAKKNRRRLDISRTTTELKASARRHARTAGTVAGLLAASVAVALAARAGWQWATTTPRLALTQIAVRGQAHATEAELLKLGPIVAGTNLLTLDAAALERALGAHPWVSAVTVTREFPSRLVVEVVEHRPRALLALGELYLLDEAGIPFKRLTVGDSSDLPLVTGVEREELLAKKQSTLTRLLQAVQVIEAYGRSATGARDALSEVHLSPDGVTLTTSGGQEIRLGESPVEAALARLDAVRAELRGRALSADLIRLDNRARPTWVTVQLSSGKP
jgi:cell division protein FtsQ